MQILVVLGCYLDGPGGSFEHVLSKILGLDWWEAAKLGRSNWKKGKYNFVSKAVRCWCGPSVIRKKAFLRIWPRSLMRGFI